MDILSIVITPETRADLEHRIAPLDMRREIMAALRSGAETRVEHYRNGGEVSACYFPNAGRGGMSKGGATDWTDCSSFEDLFRRDRDRENLWSN